ncbi:MULTISPECIES: CHAT domain-containing protein [unclassified Streptomyces]|uniref:CHAT domain-containing protein n=1 Tax=unclassified Streptomyces TaxID=2593676 RepID=UPI00324E5343
MDSGADGSLETVFIPNEVLQAMLELANSFSWEEKRQVIEARHTELLGNYADLMLVALLDQYEKEPDFHDSLTEDRALLADCRRYGVAGAFARRAQPNRGRDLTADVVHRLATTTGDEEVLQYLKTHLAVRRLVLEAVQSLVAASSLVAKRRVLERDKDLLLTAAAELSMRLVDTPDRSYQAHAELVAVARVHGIDAAMVSAYGGSEVETPPDGRAEVEEILHEVAYAERYMPTERRLGLCRRGLELVPRSDPLWAFFQRTIAECLMLDRTADRPARLEEAIGLFQAALDATQAAGLRAATAQTRAQLSHAYQERVRGDLDANRDEAVRQAELAVAELPEEASDLLAFVHITAAQALQTRRSGSADLIEAHAHARRALGLVDPEARPTDYSAIQQALGMIATRGGPDEHGDGGVAHLRNAAGALDPDEEPRNWVAAMMELARALLNRGATRTANDTEEALTVLHEALGRTDATGNAEGWARVHDYLAEAYLRRIHGNPSDNLEHVIDHAEQALTVFTRDDFPDQWATAKERFGTALRRRIAGNPIVNARQAIDHFTELADYYAAEGAREAWASIQEKLGAAHVNHPFEAGADHLALADEHLTRALQVYKERGQTASVAQVRTNLFGIGWLRVSEGEQSEAFVQEVFAHGHHALAWSTEHDNPDMRIAAHMGLGNLHWHLAGDSADDPHVAAARAHYEQAVANETEATRFDLLGTRLLLGVVMATQGDVEGALATNHALIADTEAYLTQTVTDAGRGAVLKHLGRAYDHAAILELRCGRIAEALRLVDRGRARLLLDALDVDPDSADLPEQQRSLIRRAEERVRRLRAALNSIPGPERESDAALGRQLAVAQTELSRAVAVSSAEAAAAEPWQLVPAGGVLVTPLITFCGSALFVLPHGVQELTREHVLMLSPGTHRELLGMITRCMLAAVDRDLARASPSEWTAAIDEVTDWLWTAVAAPLVRRLRKLQVPDGTRLWITTSELSNRLPLHAARRAEDGRHRTLLDDYVITYTPSIQMLHQAHRRLRQRAHDTRTALFLADSLGDLPYAAEEVATIRELFPADRRLVLAGPEISRKAVFAAAPGRQYVHMACHAYLNWLQPNYSAIPLADGGFLVAGELAGLDLSETRLVTLSACQSGISFDGKGAGEYSGLAASLLRAGAPTVVATLWAVDDHASSLLMSRFYEELTGGLGKEPAEALRRAQLWLRDATLTELTAYQSNRPGAAAAARRWRLLGYGPEDRPYASPHFWAAYTVVGV